MPRTVGPAVAGPAVLGLISRTAGAFDDQVQDLAVVFAERAPTGLAGTQSPRQFREALSTRGMIGQAKGIIMERYDVTPDTAFAVLARVYQHTNLKLRDAAANCAGPATCPGQPRAAIRRQPGT